MENRSEIYLSTLRSYIEALGGRLEITAVFGKDRIPVAVGNTGTIADARDVVGRVVFVISLATPPTPVGMKIPPTRRSSRVFWSRGRGT